jgi:hypothetical protein
VLQDEAALLKEARLPPPLTLEANTEICFFTCLLPQAGHVTPETAVALRTSSSNGLPHSLHTNSNRGIVSLLI